MTGGCGTLHYSKSNVLCEVVVSDLMCGFVCVLFYVALNSVAPELINSKHGFSEAGLAIDVYAYGMLIWAMAAGEVPWRSLQLGSWKLTAAVLDGARPALPACSEVLRALIQACWAQEAADRPDFQEVVATTRLCQMATRSCFFPEIW